MLCADDLTVIGKEEDKLQRGLYHHPVSYTHLDVYKRQGMKHIQGKGYC